MKNWLNLNNFKVLGDNLFLCIEDNDVLEIANTFNIKIELQEAVKANTDFITAVINPNSEINCDLIFFFYSGKMSDSGFLCFVLSNFIEKQLNIVALLNQLKGMSPLLEISKFKDYIINIVTNYYKITYPKVVLFHYVDDNNLVFSFNQ